MDNLTRLIESGRDIAQALELLDRAAEITTFAAAAIVTKQGLLDAARQAVSRANALMAGR